MWLAWYRRRAIPFNGDEFLIAQPGSVVTLLTIPMPCWCPATAGARCAPLPLVRRIATNRARVTRTRTFDFTEIHLLSGSGTP